MRKFFVVEADSSPTGFLNMAMEIIKEIDNMSRSRLIELYANLSTRAVKIEYVAPGKFAVYSEDLYGSVKRSYLAPSMFNSYRSCARSLAIEILEVLDNGRVLLSVNNVRSMVRGLLVHRLYYEKFAVGETEVPVESAKERIYGVIDELRKYGDGVQIFEIKSGFNPDLVGAGLQVMSYLLATSDALCIPLDKIEGYIVTPKTMYRVYYDDEVYREYRKRVERIVEIAINRQLTQLPPRLSDSNRCSMCSYRGTCLKLPDKYRTYDRFFKEQGFTRLKKNEDEKSLFNYLG